MVVTGVFVGLAGAAGARDTDPTPDDKCKNLDCIYPNECDIADLGCANAITGCKSCNKCTLQNIPCPQTIPGPQGSYSVTDSCPFDYDDDQYPTDLVNPGSTYEYCPNQKEIGAAGKGIAARNCKFIIDICECPDACEIRKGEKVGIQMEILTAGVFWADNFEVTGKAIDTISFKMYPLSSDACKTSPFKEDKFSSVKYYEKLTSKTTASGRVGYTPVSQGQPAEGCFAGNVPAGKRVQVLQSEISGDYTLEDEDVKNKLCVWMIDIPPMRLDGTAKAGDKIKVRVRLLWNRDQDLLCLDCTVPDICECVVEVGIVCCNVKTSSEGCVFFPYVLQGLQESSGWVSGVAISAVGLTALPADAYCTLTLQDQKGNTVTWTNKALGNSLVWSFVLDNIMDNFGAKLEPGATSLTVKSNYPIDGYTFMNANFGFGTGAMARGCGTKCAPNSN
jgi:hypothetical protein